MNANFEKNNPLNIQLAKDAHHKDAEQSNDLEVAICHTLYSRHPDAMEDVVFLRAAKTAGFTEEFQSVIHDLHRRGIVRKDVMGNRNLYSLTREFADIMRNL